MHAVDVSAAARDVLCVCTAHVLQSERRGRHLGTWHHTLVLNGDMQPHLQ